MKLHSYQNIVFTAIIVLFNANINAQKSNCNYFNLRKPNTIPQPFNPKILDLD